MSTLKKLLGAFRSTREPGPTLPAQLKQKREFGTDGQSQIGQTSTLTLQEGAQRALNLFQEGDLVEAERLCRLILGAQPDYFDALHLLGVIAVNTRRPHEGVELLTRALTVNSEQAQAHNNLGAALADIKNHEAALESYKRALFLDPGYAEAHKNQGAALRDLRSYEAALASFERAIALNPEFAEAHFSRGVALQNLKRYEAALTSYDRAISLNPGYVEAFYNRGSVFLEQKRYEAALEALERALQIGPDFDFLYGTWLQTKMRMCDWSGIDDFAVLEERVGRCEKAATPGILSMSGSPALQKTAAEIWTHAKYPASNALPALPPALRRDKIRVGYFSSDFHSHPVALLTAGMFEKHDRSRFELTAFSSGPDTDDEVRNRVKAAFENFIDVRDMADREVASLARSRGIDIAIDLGGHTAESRTGVFAMRAAPVQVSYLGYLGTMGAGYMDYLIADPVIVPQGARQHYAEKIAYLPSYQANDSKRRISDRRFTREELGLPRKGFVFCCFNNSYKITPQIFGGWMRILKRVEASVLFLYAENKSVEANLRQEAARRGIESGRLVFGSRLPLPEYIARYRIAGLFLDTAPYNAGTTASDALWAGLPVLTCVGETFASRIAASLLCALHLPELITSTQAEYEDLAVALALDEARLDRIRLELERNRATSPLFDTVQFTRNLEALYTRMHERSQAGMSPDHLCLPK